MLKMMTTAMAPQIHLMAAFVRLWNSIIEVLEWYHMFDFQQKRTLRSIWRSRLTQGGFLLLALLVAVSAFDRYTIAQQMADRRAAVEAEAAALEARRKALAEDVSYLSHERGIEAEMRRQFDVAREGEHVVIILDEDEAETPQPLPPLPTSTAPARPWYQFW